MSFLQLLEFAKANGLRHAVLGDDEILGGETFNDFAVLVFDADHLDDQLGGGLKPDSGSILRQGLLRAQWHQ